MKQKEHIKQWTILHMLRRANQCVSKGSINQSPQLPICINLYKKLSLAAQAASWLSFSLLAWRMAWAMRWAFHCFPGSTLQTFCNASSWRLNVTWFAILSMRQVLSFNLAATPCTRKSQSCILCRCSWMIFGNYNLFHIPDWGRKEETEETAEPICNRSFFLSWDIKERRETSRSNQNRVSSTASPMILTSKETSGSELVDWISASAQIPALTPVTPMCCGWPQWLFATSLGRDVWGKVSKIQSPRWKLQFVLGTAGFLNEFREQNQCGIVQHSQSEANADYNPRIHRSWGAYPRHSHHPHQ